MVTQQELIKKFREVDLSDFPDFDDYEKSLERGLWVLWVAKDKFSIKKMTSEDIAMVIRDAKEESTNAKSINNAFTRAKNKIHIYHEGDTVYFEIMKPGKLHLLSKVKEDTLSLIRFEPDKRYTSKRILSKNVLDGLNGELRVVDPYLGERALDLLADCNTSVIKVLTRLDNLRSSSKKNKIIREVTDFKSEYPNVEFRDYPNPDIHDRFIISDDKLVLLGHGMNDLGGKESFAIVLDNISSKNVFDETLSGFNRRWKQSTPI